MAMVPPVKAESRVVSAVKNGDRWSSVGKNGMKKEKKLKFLKFK